MLDGSLPNLFSPCLLVLVFHEISDVEGHCDDSQHGGSLPDLGSQLDRSPRLELRTHRLADRVDSLTVSERLPNPMSALEYSGTHVDSRAHGPLHAVVPRRGQPSAVHGKLESAEFPIELGGLTLQPVGNVAVDLSLQRVHRPN